MRSLLSLAVSCVLCAGCFNSVTIVSSFILAQITLHLVLVVSPAEYRPVVSVACRPSC